MFFTLPQPLILPYPSQPNLTLPLVSKRPLGRNPLQTQLKVAVQQSTATCSTDALIVESCLNYLGTFSDVYRGTWLTRKRPPPRTLP